MRMLYGPFDQSILYTTKELIDEPLKFDQVLVIYFKPVVVLPLIP